MQDQEPLAVSIEDVVRTSGLCRTTVYQAIGAGQLRARKVGRRTLILRADLTSWLQSLPAIEPKHAA
jgi:excisionase family DNA binding protein